MKWKKIGRNTIISFTEPGQSIAGVYQGSRQGQFGLLGDIEVDGVMKSFPLTAALQTRLADVKLGTTVRIDYVGEEVSKKTGRTFKNFEVFRKDDGPEGEAEEQGKPEEEEVPF